jgi:hypothetical protein
MSAPTTCNCKKPKARVATRTNCSCRSPSRHAVARVGLGSPSAIATVFEGRHLRSREYAEFLRQDIGRQINLSQVRVLVFIPIDPQFSSLSKGCGRSLEFEIPVRVCGKFSATLRKGWDISGRFDADGELVPFVMSAQWAGTTAGEGRIPPFNWSSLQSALYRLLSLWLRATVY